MVDDIEAHEAAHVVVGIALGLKLRHATARPSHIEGALGFAWFQSSGHPAAHALMYAAGCAYERSVGGVWLGTWDERYCREHLPGRGGFQAAVRAADAMLRGLHAEHVQVSLALRRRDIGPSDVLRMARGERIT